MKTKVYTIILTLIMIFGFMGTNYYSNTYSMRGVVTSVQGQIVTLTDETRNVWQISSEGFKKGDRVRIRWFNNTTDMIREDDEIINVKVVK